MLLCKSRSPRRDRSCYFFAVTTCFRSFGFELQGRCSAFTSWRARKRDPKTFSLAAHNQEFVLGHVTFVLQQLFQISLERGLCFNHREAAELLASGIQWLAEEQDMLYERNQNPAISPELFNAHSEK